MSRKGQKASPETRARMAASMRARFLDPEFRARHAEKARGAWSKQSGDPDEPRAPDDAGFLADLRAAYPQGMPDDVPVKTSRARPALMIAHGSSYAGSPAAACVEGP